MLPPSSVAIPSPDRLPSPVAADRRFRTGAILLLAALLLWRVVYLAILPLDLSPDESYYWDWTRSPDWSYFSKPPMVAWLIWLSTALLGDSDFGVRLPAAVLGIGSLGLIFLLARRMFDVRTAFWAVAATASSVGFAIGGYIMTIDAPLLFSWCLALYAFWRVQEGGEENGKWLFIAIAACGLGLLSKLMMAAFLPLALGFLLSSRPRPQQTIRNYWLPLTLGSSLFLLPFLLWNSRYDWITFRHTGAAFNGPAWELRQAPGWMAEFIGSQIGLGNPLLILLLIALMAVAWRQPDKRIRYLWFFCAPPLALVLALSATQPINANWPLVFYPAGYILLAAWAGGYFSVPQRPRPGHGRLFRTGVASGLVLVVFLYALPWLTTPLKITGGGFDPGVRLRDWRETARRIEPHWQDFKSSSQSGFLLVAGRRDTVSALAFYLEDHPLVYIWPDDGRKIANQYHLWEGAETRINESALIVVEGADRPLPRALAARFRHTTRLATITAASNRYHQRNFTLYRADILEQWPEPAGKRVRR